MAGDDLAATAGPLQSGVVETTTEEIGMDYIEIAAQLAHGLLAGERRTSNERHIVGDAKHAVAVLRACAHEVQRQLPHIISEMEVVRLRKE